ncbi:MAG: hypothetical protein HC901_04550 [Bdellovibrionaceae bacterium]|nr:hypothetical protein [Pseudobdellovibrionaceae bacterium]
MTMTSLAEAGGDCVALVVAFWAARGVAAAADKSKKGKIFISMNPGWEAMCAGTHLPGGLAVREGRSAGGAMAR